MEPVDERCVRLDTPQPDPQPVWVAVERTGDDGMLPAPEQVPSSPQVAHFHGAGKFPGPFSQRGNPRCWGGKIPGAQATGQQENASHHEQASDLRRGLIWVVALRHEQTQIKIRTVAVISLNCLAHSANTLPDGQR